MLSDKSAVLGERILSCRISLTNYLRFFFFIQVCFVRLRLVPLSLWFQTGYRLEKGGGVPELSVSTLFNHRIDTRASALRVRGVFCRISSVNESDREGIMNQTGSKLPIRLELLEKYLRDLCRNYKYI